MAENYILCKGWMRGRGSSEIKVDRYEGSRRWLSKVLNDEKEVAMCRSGAQCALHT